MSTDKRNFAKFPDTNAGGDVILTCKRGVNLKNIKDKNPKKRFIAQTGKNSG
jgi:hypothetical protein